MMTLSQLPAESFEHLGRYGGMSSGQSSSLDALRALREQRPCCFVGAPRSE